jgi:membrane-bound lytic murein transglycosylase B
MTKASNRLRRVAAGLFMIVFAMPIWANAKSKKNLKPSRPPQPSLSFVQKKLERSGFSNSFVRDVIASYEPKDFGSVVELNVLLFLRKSDYHGPQVNEEAERQVRKFTEANRTALAKAEAMNNVPSSVIASLLWIESRHGQNAGDFHVPSVYLHLLQSPRVSVQKYLLTRTAKYTAKTTKADRKEIIARTHRKAEWALSELRALEKVHRWKWKMGSEFRGSFSGAFGIPQFIPSSYVKWARSIQSDTNPSSQPDLSKPSDSIMSVAYYLRDHGWKSDDVDSHVETLMTYNNSRDYANAILSLAEKTGAQSSDRKSDQSSDRNSERSTASEFKERR